MHRTARYLLSSMSLVLLLTLTTFAEQSDFKTKHTLYVGCSEGTPFYAQLTDAVAAAKPYTLIKVCPGQYENGSVSNTDFLKIEGKGQPGSVVVNCISPSTEIDGIDVYGKYNWIDNIPKKNTSTKVSNSIINGGGGVGIEPCDGCRVLNNKFAGSNGIVDVYTTNDVISGNEIINCGTTNGILLTGNKAPVVTNNKVTGCGDGYKDLLVSDGNISSNDFSSNTSFGIHLSGDDTNTTVKNNTTNGNGEIGIYVSDPNGADSTSGKHSANHLDQNNAHGNGTDDLYDDTAGKGCTDTDGTCNIWHKNKAHVCYPSGICP
jgi:parallel beta-helix repeat protein